VSGEALLLFAERIVETLRSEKRKDFPWLLASLADVIADLVERASKEEAIAALRGCRALILSLDDSFSPGRAQPPVGGRR
jgi:hypothetical protein